jgi:hypothetical protein
MGTLTDDQLRVLRFLARRPGGCTEATLPGFTGGPLCHLVFTGQPSYEGAGRPKFRVKITVAGRKAIEE